MSDHRRAIAALLLVQLLFGTLGPIGKVALPTFGSTGIAAWRIAGGALVFTLLRRARGLPPVPASDRPRLILCAAIGIAANQLLFLKGLSLTDSVHATLLVTTTPLFTMAASALVARERPSGRQLGGVALALGGVGLLLGPKLGAGAWLGDALVLGNTALYAIYLVLSRPLLERHPPLSVAAGLFGWATPMVLLLGGPDQWSAPAEVWAAMAWILVGPTVGTYLLNLMALRSVSPTLVGLFIALQPFVAAALAIPMLGERPGLRELGAGLLAVAGVAWASWRPRPA